MSIYSFPKLCPITNMWYFGIEENGAIKKLSFEKLDDAKKMMKLYLLREKIENINIEL